MYKSNKVPGKKAYPAIIAAFKKNRNGLTPGDISAKTGLPLNEVKELVSLASDEYSARLEVTESGEILYSLPNGFHSRYRGLFPVLKRFLSSSVQLLKTTLVFMFKTWIMIMLFGYFLLFMALAFASVFISVSGSSGSGSRRGRGGWHFSGGIFNMIFRLWFYSEVFGRNGRRNGSSLQYRTSSAVKGKPLHRAVFSFVFGEEDPNRERETGEKKAFISYVRKKRGVVSVPELMIITGLPPMEAEKKIASFSAEFGGSPEVTGDGSIVYRFEEILLSGEKAEDQSTDPPNPFLKTLKKFSGNQSKMNLWFGILNGINLLFGTWFFYHSYSIGNILNEAALRAAGIYGMVYYFLLRLGTAPLPVIRLVLGFIPLSFSLLFWLIPFVRSLLLKKENNMLRLDNFRSFGFSRIWKKPKELKLSNLDPKEEIYRPDNLDAARETVLKEMSSYSAPEVILDENQNEVFSFPELEREKEALEKYRLSFDQKGALTGKTIFDTGQ